MIFAFISLIFNKISGIKIDQVTIFRNSVVVNQLVMNKPLDQMRSTGVNAPNRTSKLVNKSEFNGSILNRLMNFATALSFKISSHSRQMCCFIARAVRTERDFNL